MSGNNAIVLMSTKDMLFALGALVANINNVVIRGCSSIIIYHDGISDNEMTALKSIDSRCKFILYTRESWVEEMKGNGAETESLRNFIIRYSYFATVKYKAIEHLEEFDSVVFMDTDILIRSDISEVFELRGVGWRNGMRLINKIKPYTPAHEDFNFVTAQHNTPNGGFMVFSNDIPWRKMLRDCEYFVARHLGSLHMFFDEVLISWVSYRNSVQINDLGVEYNSIPDWDNGDIKVLHTVGRQKIWNDNLLALLYPEWFRYYDVWRLASGSDHSIKLKGTYLSQSRSRLHASIRNAERWRSFFDKCDLSLGSELRISPNSCNEWLPFYIRRFGGAVYYEIKFHGASRYIVALNFKDKKHLDSAEFIENLLSLADRAHGVESSVNNDGAAIYIKNIPIEDVGGNFRYLQDITQPLLSAI